MCGRVFAQEGAERSTPHRASMSQRSSDLLSSPDSDVELLAPNRVINERSSVPAGPHGSGEKPRKGSGSATPREGCAKDASISIGGAIVSSDDGGAERPRKDSQHRKGSHQQQGLPQKLRGFSLTGSAATIQRCAEMSAEGFTRDGVAAALTRCCCGVGSCAARGRRTTRISCRRSRRNYWPTPPSCSRPRPSNGECTRL